eukprot:3061047-Prorocentrum_lima.AAC.1
MALGSVRQPISFQVPTCLHNTPANWLDPPWLLEPWSPVVAVLEQCSSWTNPVSHFPCENVDG